MKCPGAELLIRRARSRPRTGTPFREKLHGSSHFGLTMRLCTYRITPLLCSCFLGFTLAASAAEHWTRVATAHFEMYTTNSEKQATRALQTFEGVRYFFTRIGRSNFAPDERVRIIAFSSEKEYKPYRVSDGAFAYYLHTRERDYIVMQDIAPEHYPAAVHEYTHLVIDHLKLRLPVWLNEGLADFYSSLEAQGDRATVGRPLPGRVATLFNQRWMDWKVLFAVDRNSPYYNENGKMSIFYAQSWALTHMLEAGDGYRESFPKFLGALAIGKPAQEAFQAVYGKSLNDVDKDLRHYLERRTVYALVFDVKLQKSELEPDIQPLSDLQQNLTLADLLASQESKATEARIKLAALARQYPDSAEVEESLGYLAWQQRDVQQARIHFGLAVERHSQNSQMLLAYAQMQRTAGTPAKEVIPILAQSLALNPGSDDTRLELALAALSDKQFGYALSVLSGFKTIGPEHAYLYFSALAYCRINLQDEASALTYAQQALHYAKSAGERSSAEDLLSFLNRARAASASATQAPH